MVAVVGGVDDVARVVKPVLLLLRLQLDIGGVLAVPAVAGESSSSGRTRRSRWWRRVLLAMMMMMMMMMRGWLLMCRIPARLMC